jgi:TRAP-type mannitol/chloroaromatic compound transport system substrate-binding protein
VGSHQPKADPNFQVTVDIGKRVEIMSEGRMVWDVFTGGEIVPAMKEVTGIHEGVLDASSNPAVWSLELFPAAGLFFQVAGGLTPVPQAIWYLVGGGFELIREMYAPLNVHVVTIHSLRNPEVWAHSSKPLKTADDFKGLKMRALGDPGNILANMGVAVTSTHGSEIYESMQRGVIDAFEMGPFGPNWNMGFQEVAKYVYQSPSRGPTDMALFYVNEQKWNALPPDLQNMIETATWREGWQYYANEVKNEGAYIQKFKDYGCIVEPLPAAIETAFMAEAQKYYDAKSAADPFYAKVVQSQREFKKITDSLNIR